MFDWQKSLRLRLVGGLSLLVLILLSSFGIIIAFSGFSPILSSFSPVFPPILLLILAVSLGGTIIFAFIFDRILTPFIQLLQNLTNTANQLVDHLVQGDLQKLSQTTFPHLTRPDEIGDLSQSIQNIAEELCYFAKEYDQKVTQLELAEISAVQSFQELQIEKQKVEQTTEKLAMANEEITLLNERLKDENLGLMAELKATNQRLNQFLDAVPVGVIVLDAKGKTFYANNKAKQLLNFSLYPYWEMIGSCPVEQPLLYSLDDDHYPIYQAGTEELYPPEKRMGVQSLKLGKIWSSDDMEIRYQNKVIPLETWETPIFDSNGEIGYGIIAFQDITERRKAEEEKLNFTRELLQLNEANQRFVPRQLLQLLKKESIIDVKLGDNVEKDMTVLFSDIRGFTSLSEHMTPEDNYKFINAYLSRMSPVITANSGFIDKYIGDAIMALFTRSADDAVQAGISMLQHLADYNTTRQRPDRPPLSIGIGINTGLMRLGIVGGSDRIEGTVISDSVNLAARLENLTKTYGISLIISHHTFLQLADINAYHFRIIDRVFVHGKSTPVTVYEIFDADAPEIFRAKQATKTMFEHGLLLYYSRHYQEAGRKFRECLQINPHDKPAQIYLSRCQQSTLSTTAMTYS